MINKQMYFIFAGNSAWDFAVWDQHGNFPEHHVLSHHLPANWRSWAGSLPHLDLHPFLPSLCNRPVREQPDSLHHRHSAQPPRTHVLFPLHAVHHWPRAVHIHTGHHVGDILGQCQGDQLQCLLVTDVLYSTFHCHGILRAVGYGLWSFCGHF